MKTILEISGEFKDRMRFMKTIRGIRDRMKIIPELTSPESAIM